MWIVKEGNDYAAFYSLDGEDWIYIAQYADQPLANLWVGVGARMGPEPVSVTADFDSFAAAYYRYRIFLPIVMR